MSKYRRDMSLYRLGTLGGRFGILRVIEWKARVVHAGWGDMITWSMVFDDRY